MNREDVAMDVTVQSVEILRERLEQAEALLREAEQNIWHPNVVKGADTLAPRINAFLASQQGEFVPGHGEHFLPSWRSGQVQGKPHILDFCTKKHPEQAEGAQGELHPDLKRVYDVIGLHYSHPVSVLISNFENTKRFSDLLHAVEREFFMVPGEPSDEPEDEGCEPDDVCLVSCWGSTQEQYIEQFREALTVIQARAALAQPSPAGEYGDAYQGAREDLAIWKRRALEAEQALREEKILTERLGNALNDENGPTFMGEPKLEQPSPAPELELPQSCGPMPDIDLSQYNLADVEGLQRWAFAATDELTAFDSIVGALRAEIARLDDGWKVANGIALLNSQERDAAQARLAELEKQEPEFWYRDDGDGGVEFTSPCDGFARPLYAAPVAQAGQVPEAWLDVQAERRRQIEAEGWTPDHDDEHGGGQMARAAACYALSGSCAPNDETAAILVDLAWPWSPEWWKPTTSRRDLVKSAALIFAELERLDRAAAAPAQGGRDE